MAIRDNKSKNVIFLEKRNPLLLKDLEFMLSEEKFQKLKALIVE